MPDTRSLFAKLGDSRKFFVFALVLVLTFVLVLTGRATYAQFVDTAKWVGAAFIGATGIEGLKTITAAGDVNVEAKKEMP